MYKDWFEFKPTHKLWIFGNHKPNIHGTDEGIWRRIKLIPFTVTIPEDKRKPMRYLLESFEQELSGILNWALQGYVEYREKGLGEPKEVINAINEYREEMDLIGQFITECCITGSNERIIAKNLWEKYKNWMESNGEQYVNGRRFYSRLREHGYEVRANSRKITEVCGLSLNEEFAVFAEQKL